MQFMNAPAFKENAKEAMADANLREAMGMLRVGFTARRKEAAAGLAEFDDFRARAKEIKEHTLTNLDTYLELFEENCTAAGGKVHWCPTADDARAAVLEICRSVEAKTVTKGKSMVAEELHLNQFLERNDIRPIETDLGEYIVQLAEEPPSHIIGPAIHKTKDQVSDLFQQHHRQYGMTERQTEPQKMIAEARQVLRQKFQDADVGITGANFLIAETGSTMIVTNEGNGDLTQMLPKVHVVVTSIEKVVPTLEDVSTILRVLARSATGQDFAAYTTLSTGPKRADDLSGPDEFHVVILDNGRSAMLGGEFQDMLRCIRCGACMNHCPVYQSVGGHTYGAVYVGPMGSVLTPSLRGIDEAKHLPNASTFCGRCESVCPMMIPLPKMMRHWREQAFESGVSPAAERVGVKTWAFFARHPSLYRPGARLAAWALNKLGGNDGRLRKLWGASGWTKGRDLPAPAGQTFQAQWRKRARA